MYSQILPFTPVPWQSPGVTRAIAMPSFHGPKVPTASGRGTARDGELLLIGDFLGDGHGEMCWLDLAGGFSNHFAFSTIPVDDGF